MPRTPNRYFVGPDQRLQNVVFTFEGSSEKIQNAMKPDEPYHKYRPVAKNALEQLNLVKNSQYSILCCPLRTYSVCGWISSFIFDYCKKRVWIGLCIIVGVYIVGLVIVCNHV